MVSEGKLDPYLATCRAKADARKAIAPMLAEIDALYAPIGEAYSAWMRTETRERGAAWFAQGVNNAIRFSASHDFGERRPALMGASEVRSAVERDGLAPEVAVAVLAERIEQLRALRAAWDAFAA
jgi:hypothetical protein